MKLRVQAKKIRSRIDVNTMERPPASHLGLNDIGIVEFEATRNLAFDLYSQNRNSGSFILIDPLTNATVGAGMITENLETAKQRAGHEVAGVAQECGGFANRSGGDFGASPSQWASSGCGVAGSAVVTGGATGTCAV